MAIVTVCVLTYNPDWAKFRNIALLGCIQNEYWKISFF